MYENISIVASIPQYHFITIIYTFVCSFFFAYKMYIIYKKFHQPHKFCLLLIIIAALSMPIGSLFTYGTSLLNSNIHIYTSIISCIIFLFLLFVYMYYLSIDYVDVYLKCYRQFYLCINILAIIVVVIGRINGIIEIFYVIIVSLTLEYCDKHI
ncbi:MAG: hypothetical protein LUG12_10070 [Erysipelotrichaceae bacterium]|nr:hypothetical protein [Erysipelotrichaceae bacterium]